MFMKYATQALKNNGYLICMLGFVGAVAFGLIKLAAILHTMRG